MAFDAHELQRLEAIARQIERKSVLARTGYYGSEVDEEIDRKQRGLMPRQDLVASEAVERVLLFLRTLFAAHKSLTWKTQGDGHTDASASAIVIESQLASGRRPYDAEKPSVLVRPGPTSTSQVSIGNLKHWEPFSDTKTYTALEPGTIQILIHHTVPAAALELAHFIKNALMAGEENLRFRGFHAIQNVAVGGYDEDNPQYNRSVDRETHVIIPLTFTYFHQTSWRVGPRKGTYEEARSLIHGVQVLDTDLPPDPYIDGRPDDVLESEGYRVIVPLELED